MSKTKVLSGIILIVAVLFAQVGVAFAAPASQTGTTTTLTGNITSIATQQDANGNTIIVVTLDGYQPITLTEQEAADNGLYDLNTQQLLAQVGDSVQLTVDSTKVIPTGTTPEEPVNPVAGILAAFFGVDASTINQYHEDGFGFGVIAQALWMAQGLNGDVSTAGLILEAKQTGDYSAFVLPDGSTPTNWGQFKKAALGKEKKNLGIIVSGKAENSDYSTSVDTLQNRDNGKNKNKVKGPGNGNGNGNGNKP